MRRFFSSLLAFVIVSLASVASATANDVETVTVIGNGETVEAARLDAIRQATTQVIGQTTIAERKIKDDDIVYDRVLSTVTGFIASFDLLSTEETALGFRVSANIGISTSRIRSYVGIIEPGFARIDGGGLFAEQTRKLEQYATLGAMFDGLFRTGFPANHIDVDIIDVGFQGADQIKITFETSIAPEFAAALEGFYQEVGFARCDTPNDPHLLHSAKTSSAGASRRTIENRFKWNHCVPLGGRTLDEARELVLAQLELTPGLEDTTNGGWRPGHCFYADAPEPRHYCYFLPEGDYMRALTEARDALRTGGITRACVARVLEDVHGETLAADANIRGWFVLDRLLFMIAPKRSDGSLAVKNGRPLIWNLQINQLQFTPHIMINGGKYTRGRTGVTFNLERQRVETVFPVDQIDVSDVQSIEILPTWGYMPDLVGTLEDIGPLPVEACDRTLEVVKSGTSAVLDRLYID